MGIEELRQNIQHCKSIVREMYIFTNHLNMIQDLEIKGNRIDSKEKLLLIRSVDSLKEQLRILNKTIPSILEGVYFFKGLSTETKKEDKNLIKVNYSTKEENKKNPVSLTIDKKDKEKFIEHVAKSQSSIQDLKSSYSTEVPAGSGFGSPSVYGKFSNKYFRNSSNDLLKKGYLTELNKELRKMNSPFVVNTYSSMILMTMTLSLIFGLGLFFILLFYQVSIIFPFFSPVEESLLIRFFKIVWIIPIIPLISGAIMYYYPASESKSIGERINQELPFVTIYMAGISSSGVSPVNMFNIILRSAEYTHTNREIRKIMNLVNFQGYDLVTALKKCAVSSPSYKLKELLNGFVTTITSGGDLHEFLNKHAETMLFDYRLEREKYTKSSEIFMDIYISLVIAAPMILLILFVIMGSTGMSFMGLDVGVMGFLIIGVIAFLNVGFLVFLKLKQPVF